MESERYRIQFGNLNIGAQKMTDEIDGTYTLTTTMGQTAAGEFQSTGYIIKAGFQYIYSIIPFTFSVSSINVNLGNLLPNTPSTSPINLTVSFGGAGQYLVTAIEETPLQTMDGTTIPDTVCDGGEENTCSETVAKPWTSLSAYGFGYNMTGDDIPTDFINSNYFRPFPDKSADESPAIIMQSSNVSLNPTPTTYPPAPTGLPHNITHQSTLTFKANISPLQPAGSYQTVINFTATPSF